jgi:DNA-binding SARP family transcriptional activator
VGWYVPANRAPSNPRAAVLPAQLRPLARAQLCALFWPDVPDAVARRNLTHLLTHLRHALPRSDLLHVHGDHLALDPAGVSSDTATLTQHAASARLPLDALREAAELLRGPFLAGFSLPDCPEFEAWADRERARWERVSHDLFATLAECAAAEERYDDAIWVAEHGLAVDELDEALHRRLMQLHGLLGDRAAVEHPSGSTWTSSTLTPGTSAASSRLPADARETNVRIPIV